MYAKIFSVPYYGLDARKRMKPGVLLQFFQEIAACHANSVGIGVEDLMARDMTWVLRRYRVSVLSCPGRGDIDVRTWFEPKRNLMSVRAFSATGADGSVIANAWSSWIVVDLKRGRPVRLDRALPDRYFEMAEDTGGEVADGLPGALRDFDAEASFRTRRSELDLNGHTNHTVYFDWVLECAPDEIAVESYPVLLDAEFLASAKRESVAVRTKKISGSRARYDHSVILSATGEEAARISVTWAKI